MSGGENGGMEVEQSDLKAPKIGKISKYNACGAHALYLDFFPLFGPFGQSWDTSMSPFSQPIMVHVGLFLLLVSTHGSKTTQYQQDTTRHHPDRASSTKNTYEVGVVSPDISNA